MYICAFLSLFKCLGDWDLEIDTLDAHGLIYKLNFF